MSLDKSRYLVKTACAWRLVGRLESSINRASCSSFFARYTFDNCLIEAAISGTMSPSLVISFLFSFFVSQVNSFSLTDTITWGGDNSRTGYQT
jgi:hypothetical protein